MSGTGSSDEIACESLRFFEPQVLNEHPGIGEIHWISTLQPTTGGSKPVLFWFFWRLSRTQTPPKSMKPQELRTQKPSETSETFKNPGNSFEFLKVAHALSPPNAMATARSAFEVTSYAIAESSASMGGIPTDRHPVSHKSSWIHIASQNHVSTKVYWKHSVYFPWFSYT